MKLVEVEERVQHRRYSWGPVRLSISLDYMAKIGLSCLIYRSNTE